MWEHKYMGSSKNEIWMEVAVFAIVQGQINSESADFMTLQVHGPL